MEKVKNDKFKKKKKARMVFKIIQSCLIPVLIALVVVMFIQIDKLQGTAKVVNYAGIVRGASQRLVKLEIMGNTHDEIILYLDDVLNDLKYGGGDYELISLDNNNYQKKLDKLVFYWDDLKEQIVKLRNSNKESENVQNLLNMSETYFEIADEAVFAAEEYSDKIAKRIRIVEHTSAAVMILLLLLWFEQMLYTMKMNKKNIVLERKAYIDTHTGLKNKNMCEELLGQKKYIDDADACIMFDINNLKTTNDTLGHSVGDLLIADFAKVLRSVIRDDDFAGRCGGDEFMVVLYNVEDNTVEDVLERIKIEVEQFNRRGKHTPISYACGWAVSTNYKNCTFRKLFDEADHNMYENKQEMKKSK